LGSGEPPIVFIGISRRDEYNFGTRKPPSRQAAQSPRRPVDWYNSPLENLSPDILAGHRAHQIFSAFVRLCIRVDYNGSGVAGRSPNPDHAAQPTKPIRSTGSIRKLKTRFPVKQYSARH